MRNILQLCLASFVGVKNFLFLFWGILLFGITAKLGVRFVFLLEWDASMLALSGVFCVLIFVLEAHLLIVF